MKLTMNRNLLPHRIGAERRPVGFRGLAARVRDHINERALVRRAVLRHPVADIRHAVLLEYLHGVFAEALVQGVQPAGEGVIGADFEHLSSGFRAGGARPLQAGT